MFATDFKATNNIIADKSGIFNDMIATEGVSADHFISAGYVNAGGDITSQGAVSAKSGEFSEKVTTTSMEITDALVVSKGSVVVSGEKLINNGIFDNQGAAEFGDGVFLKSILNVDGDTKLDGSLEVGGSSVLNVASATELTVDNLAAKAFEVSIRSNLMTIKH